MAETSPCLSLHEANSRSAHADVEDPSEMDGQLVPATTIEESFRRRAFYALLCVSVLLAFSCSVTFIFRHKRWNYQRPSTADADASSRLFFGNEHGFDDFAYDMGFGSSGRRRAFTVGAESATSFCYKGTSTCWSGKPVGAPACTAESGQTTCLCSGTTTIDCLQNSFFESSHVVGRCLSRVVYVLESTTIIASVASGTVTGSGLEVYCTNMVADDSWESSGLFAKNDDPVSATDDFFECHAFYLMDHTWKNKQCQRDERYLGESCDKGFPCKGRGSDTYRTICDSGFGLKASENVCQPQSFRASFSPCECPTSRENETVQLCYGVDSCVGTCMLWHFPTVGYFCDMSAHVEIADSPLGNGSSFTNFIEDEIVDDLEQNVLEDPPVWTTCSAQPGTKYYPCEDGYRPVAACQIPFTYRDTSYSTCAPPSNPETGWPWCSKTAELTSSFDWEYCIPCTENFTRPDDTTWLGLKQDVACTSVFIVAGTNASNGLQTLTLMNGFGLSQVQKVVPIYSAGKWPSTVAIMGAVQAGHLTLDTRAADVFDWWTNSASDARSNVTLRNCLQFMSGFYVDAVLNTLTMGHVTIPCMSQASLVFDHFTSMEDCAKQVYERAKFDPARLGKWPDNLNYNSLHMVISFAMATKKTGMAPSDYLSTYLYQPAGMTSTSCSPRMRPILAGYMQSTIADYQNFLYKYLTYQILPKDIIDDMEGDTGNDALMNAMGHAVHDGVHSWGGGLYASVDRRYGTYQLVFTPISEYFSGVASLVGTFTKDTLKDDPKAFGAITKWLELHEDIETVLRT